MSFIPTTVDRFNREFKKFKESKPESSGAVSGVMLDKWHDEFLNLKLHQAWKQGMLYARKIIQDKEDSECPVLDATEAIDEELENNAAPG